MKRDNLLDMTQQDRRKSGPHSQDRVANGVVTLITDDLLGRAVSMPSPGSALALGG